jgi:TP53 regulating kinase and related kinases
MSGTESVTVMSKGVVVTPSASSSYVKNESWTLISQGAEARVWKVPFLALEQHTTTTSSEQQEQRLPEQDATIADDTYSNNGKSSPPVKRTRLEQENHHHRVYNEQQPPQLRQQQYWMVAKERFKKSYRHAQLDERLTRQRCRMEARILEKCYHKSCSRVVTTGNNNHDAAGTTPIVLRVPRVFRLDPPILFLEYLPGRTVRDALEVDLLPRFVMAMMSLQQQEQGEKAAADETTTTTTTRTTDSNMILFNLSQRMGRMIRHLHNLGIVHGDLTTSNMMLIPKVMKKQPQQQNTPALASASAPSSSLPRDDKHEIANKTTDNSNNDDDDSHEFDLALIDFGLAKNTESAEERAVDLYVLERALISTHPTLPTSFIETLLDAYSSFGNDVESASSSSVSSKNGNGNSNDAKSSLSSSSSSAAAATLRRLEQVRQRGRKRECFG